MNIRAFIVEDNLPFAIELEMHLKSWGYQVVGACDNGEEALVLIKQELPNLILMDIGIIGLYSGIEVAKKIAALNIPIIYMTGEKDNKKFHDAKSTTGISYLIKPFDMLTLKGVIEFYFERQFKPLPTEENMRSFTNELFVRKNKELVKIDYSTIDSINSSGNYCIISSGRKRYIIRKSMKQTLDLLPEGKFIKIHKSYCIKIEAISGIFLSENKVRVGDELLPLGRKYKKQLLEMIKYIQ